MSEEINVYQKMINKKLFQNKIHFYYKINLAIAIYVIAISLTNTRNIHPLYEWSTWPFLFTQYFLVIKIYTYKFRTISAIIKYFKRKKPKTSYQKLIYQELNELKKIREEMLSHDDDPGITLFDDLIKNE